MTEVHRPETNIKEVTKFLDIRSVSVYLLWVFYSRKSITLGESLEFKNLTIYLYVYDLHEKQRYF